MNLKRNGIGRFAKKNSQENLQFFGAENVIYMYYDRV